MSKNQRMLDVREDMVLICYHRKCYPSRKQLNFRTCSFRKHYGECQAKQSNINFIRMICVHVSQFCVFLWIQRIMMSQGLELLNFGIEDSVTGVKCWSVTSSSSICKVTIFLLLCGWKVVLRKGNMFIQETSQSTQDGLLIWGKISEMIVYTCKLSETTLWRLKEMQTSYL